MDTIRIACATKHALGQRIVELHRFYGSRIRSTYREPVQRWVGNRRYWTAILEIAPVEERPAELEHISRIDSRSRRSYGWLVRLQRGAHRRVKWFADGQYGGRDLALAAARQWRDTEKAALLRRYVVFAPPV